MADTFLGRVAKELYARVGTALSDCTIIFPNKRPQPYFLHALAAQVSEPIPAPQIYSIEEFIAANATGRPAEPLQLLFILYKVYRQYQPEEEFEKFYNWGNLLLKDYDEIDRYLVDTRRLFGNLSAVKELEHSFMPADEQEPFWQNIDREKPLYLQERFLQLWDLFGRVYYDFRKELELNGLAYPGMAYREVADKCENGLDLDKGTYVFIGFNALSKAEETIISSLLEQKKALIYWDTDAYYLDNEREEAGQFIRRSMQRLHGYNEQTISEKLLKEEKTIHIIGVPLKVGQAKAMGLEVKHYLEKSNSSRNTAIVLPDENLLIPVLHALPQRAGHINITAGYPLQHTSLFTLFENVIALQENYLPESRSFYYKDVLAILSHPYLRCRNQEEIDKLVETIETNEWIYIGEHEFDRYKSCPAIGIIFREVKKLHPLIAYFHEILKDTTEAVKAGSPDEERLFAEFQHILDHISAFLVSQDFDVSRNTYLRLFREAVAHTRIPITDDKQDAIQIMGTLETRCLNFDTLFISSVNEGTLPGSKKTHSYIPYDLRKSFGLPTFDEQDALYAYYFYRLIQGAKTVYLIYNSETGSKGEEKSRYIRQIEHYLVKANPNIKLDYKFYSLPLKNQQPQEISVEKDDTYFSVLQKKNSEKGFSPSLISSYFVCSLQFLLQHIVQLRPQDEIAEDLEASHFGTLFHALMQKVYEEFKGGTVTREHILLRKASLNNLLDKVLDESHKKQKEYILRRNSLLVETIKVIAERTLEADLEYAPFTLIDTEVRLEHAFPVEHPLFSELLLQGIVDRIDEKDGRVRIVDYKTGYVRRFSFQYREVDEKVTKDNKEAFQTLFYAYLYHKNYNSPELQPTILPLKEINKGYRTVNESEPLPGAESFAAFETKLREVLHTILDKEQPVSQIDDLNICSVCSYNNFCLR